MPCLVKTRGKKIRQLFFHANPDSYREQRRKDWKEKYSIAEMVIRIEVTITAIVPSSNLHFDTFTDLHIITFADLHTVTSGNEPFVSPTTHPII